MPRAIVIVLMIGVISSDLSAQEKKAASKPSTGIEPSHADLKSGPHARNVMDVWLAKSDKPTPVLVSIHGGAFQNGSQAVGAGLRDLCLNAKISVVAVSLKKSQGSSKATFGQPKTVQASGAASAPR